MAKLKERRQKSFWENPIINYAIMALIFAVIGFTSNSLTKAMKMSHYL